MIILTMYRRRDGCDWETIAKNLGVGAVGGLYATTDDGNQAWEDIDYESDNAVEFESLWKHDEAVNQETTTSSIHDQDLQSKGSGLMGQESRQV
jgi:hypothetical protein